MYLDDIDEKKLTEYTDEELLSLSIKNPQFFAEIVDRYQDAFLRKVENILHQREISEEVVQEAFAKIYQYADRYEIYDNASFKSWAYKIVINTALTQYQKNKKLRERTAQLDPEYYEMLPDLKSRDFEKAEMRDYVVSILSRLPDHLAYVLELHFLKGLSQQEIAERQEESVGAVKTRVHRAKQAFREVAQELE